MIVVSNTSPIMNLAAKKRGILPGVRPVLDDLVGRAGFWVRAELYAKVLAEAGE